MKKILALALLTASVPFLHADTNGSSNYYQSQPQPLTPPSSGYSTNTESQSRSYENKSYQGNGYQNGTPSSSQYGSSHYSYSESTTKTATDQELKIRVQNTLSNSKYRDINVNVVNGVATLQGSVESADDKVKLGALVEGIEGIRSVNNQVILKNGDSSTNGSQNYQGGSEYSTTQSYQSKSYSTPNSNGSTSTNGTPNGQSGQGTYNKNGAKNGSTHSQGYSLNNGS